MKVKLSFLLIYIALSYTAGAQQLTIIDQATSQTIANVTVFNEGKTEFTQSNALGEVNLEVFSGEEILYFQHPSYQTKEFTRSQLEEQDFIVKLEEKVVLMEEAIIAVNR